MTQERRTNIASQVTVSREMIETNPTSVVAYGAGILRPSHKLTIYRTGGVVTCGECGTTITSDNTNEGGLITLHPCGHNAWCSNITIIDADKQVGFVEIPPATVTNKEEEPEMNRLEILQSQRDRLDERIAYLESLPQEPIPLEGETANVIWFEKAFRDEQTYTYAAVKAGDGLWYTTGPRTPKGYAWSDLIQWIQADEDAPVEVWAASEYELL